MNSTPDPNIKNDAENHHFRNNSGTFNEESINQTWIGDPPGWLDPYPHQQPWDSTPKNRKVKRKTRTIEKYDPQGKLISKEVITEEEEIFDKIVWSNDYTVFTDNVGIHNPVLEGTVTDAGDYYQGSSITQEDPNIPYTLTSGQSISNVVANY